MRTIRTDNTLSSITQLFGRDLLGMTERAQTLWLSRAVAHWSGAGFLHVELTKSEIQSRFARLCQAPFPDLRREPLLSASSEGLRLANSYHPQMWQARSHRHRRCPQDYFQDKHHLRAMLKRAPRFWPNRRCWAPQAVRNLVRIYAGGRVANFRPIVARDIISHFSPSKGQVLDFSAGYGGRLLGCLALDRSYTGIDPARLQVTGLRKMYRDLKDYSVGTATILRGCAEEILPSLGKGAVDLVFSSPPFFNLERYSEETTQSYLRYRTYSEWCTSFLHVVIEAAYRLLRRRGYFIINISDRHHKQLVQSTLQFASRFFVHSTTLQMQMRTRPLSRVTMEQHFRTEPIFVFQKR